MNLDLSFIYTADVWDKIRTITLVLLIIFAVLGMFALVIIIAMKAEGTDNDEDKAIKKIRYNL